MGNKIENISQFPRIKKESSNNESFSSEISIDIFRNSFFYDLQTFKIESKCLKKLTSIKFKYEAFQELKTNKVGKPIEISIEEDIKLFSKSYFFSTTLHY